MHGQASIESPIVRISLSIGHGIGEAAQLSDDTILPRSQEVFEMQILSYRRVG